MPGSDLDLSDPSVVLKPVEEPVFDGVDMTPQDWFILSRIDGQLTIRELLALSPASKESTLETLARLADAGLVEGPKVEKTVARPASKPAVLPVPPEGWPTPYGEFTVSDDDGDIALSPELRKLVAYFDANLEAIDYYALLGLARDAPPPQIRRAYFRWSKVFHPDKFFRQELGSYKDRLTRVFRWLNQANKTLGDARRRAEYDALLARGVVGPWAEEEAPVDAPPQPKVAPRVLRPRRPLAELLGKAKQAERAGNYEEAWELYEEALEQRESAELMNRSAECLIRLRKNLHVAEERARAATKSAPDHARYWVALAYIHELRGKHDDASALYEKALEIDPNHDGARERLDQLRARS